VTTITLHYGCAGSKMRRVTHRLMSRVLPGMFVLALWTPGPAVAQTASPSPLATPSPPRGPQVSSEVSGALSRGSTLVIAVDTTMPGGWRGLRLIEVLVRSGGQDLDRIQFDIEDNKLKVGEHDLVVGTGAVATGEYLRVGGADVVVTTGGANLSFDVDAKVVSTLPESSRFDVRVTTDLGTTAETSTKLSEPDGGGITLGTVITAVLIALLAGGFLGNIMASRRRPPVRTSIYGSIQRRIDEDAGASPPRG
jgi:hypothetical protein